MGGRVAALLPGPAGPWPTLLLAGPQPSVPHPRSALKGLSFTVAAVADGDLHVVLVSVNESVHTPAPLPQVGFNRTMRSGDQHEQRHEGKQAPGNAQEAPAMTSPDFPYPQEGLLLTHFLTVSDVARSRVFYADIFGGQVVLEENPCIVKVANSWIIMNPGGGPTPDKPDIVLRPPEATDPVSTFLNVRVADIATFYANARSKGAEFLTEPLDRKAEIRCYLRDPDGYLIEIGQATGMVKGIFADPSPGSK